MTAKSELQVKVDDTIRRATIDLNQAGEYFANSKYPGYEKNLEAVVDSLSKLVEETKSKLD